MSDQFRRLDRAYDLAGRVLSVRFGSAGGAGIIYDYDTAGRLESETAFGRALSFLYDIASNRGRLTWPDANYVTYSYDALNRVDLIRESGSTTLADYDYDALGRRATLTRGDGGVSTFTYDDASRLTGLAHDLAGGSTNDQSFAFAYTDASQLSQRITSNDLYNWIGVNFAALDYARNGLNQYTEVGAASFTYDARGNLTSDGLRAFTYDLENRLVSVDGSAFALAYDPLGRLMSTTASAATTEFLYDGDSLVAEYVSGSSTPGPRT
jgi:YD repeat-containing protein